MLLGIGDTLAGRLLIVDALGMELRTFSVKRNPACPACGDTPTIHDLCAPGYEIPCSG